MINAGDRVVVGITIIRETDTDWETEQTADELVYEVQEDPDRQAIAAYISRWANQTFLDMTRGTAW